MPNENDVSQSSPLDVQRREEEVVEVVRSAAVPVIGADAVTTDTPSVSPAVDAKHSDGEVARHAFDAQVPLVLPKKMTEAATDHKYSEENSFFPGMLPPHLLQSSDGSSCPSHESVVCREQNSAPSLCLLKGDTDSKLAGLRNQEALSNNSGRKKSSTEINSQDQDNIIDSKCNGIHSSPEKFLCDNDKSKNLLCEPSKPSFGEDLTSEEAEDCSSPPTLNPFVHRIHFRFPYDYIKVVLLTIIVVPIRVFFISISIILAYIVSSIGLYGLTPEEVMEKPFSGWKRPTKEIVRWWVHQVFVACGLQRLSIVGHRASSSEAPILVVAPHSSFFDSVAVVATAPPPSVVAKADTCHLPVAGIDTDMGSTWGPCGWPTQPMPLRWLMGFSGRLMMRGYGFHILSVKGTQASETDAPVLVVAPHSSFFDGLACYWSKVPCLVSRFENSYIPCFGKFISFTQPVFVWREDSKSRLQTVDEIKKRVFNKEGWPQVRATIVMQRVMFACCRLD
ncbi:hypothetical protein FHG87_014496 [Trinorchestia longiramus]|nr:hypothetical protein FHG87_014496 [Trinorchestia longiramus]